MCLFFTSESIYPKKFLIVWGVWSLIDVIFMILGFIYSGDVVCKVEDFAFDLALYLRALGLVGLLINLLHGTFEVNPSYVPRNRAIILRCVLIIPCVIWLVVGIAYLSKVSPDCINVAHFGIVIFALISLLAKSFCLPFSTNYTLIKRQYSHSLV